MFDHKDLAQLHSSALKMQNCIRQNTYCPPEGKALRRFSSWEVAELIFKINQSTFRGRMSAEPDLPGGEVEPDGRQRWFTLSEVNELRRRMKVNRQSLMPPRPAGKRAVRVALCNYEGGAGKSTVALHLAQAAALDGYRVLVVDMDPQSTVSRAFGQCEVTEDYTPLGILARDLIRETDRMALETDVETPVPTLPAQIRDTGMGELRVPDFIKPTRWPSIDIVANTPNAAFGEFASAKFRRWNPRWSFFAAVSRFLDTLDDEAYDLILCDCPPAIGHQTMNAVFAADMLYVPSGPNYFEFDSTTRFIGRLTEALRGLKDGFDAPLPDGKMSLPKEFAEVKFMLTRFDPADEAHQKMRGAYAEIFGDRLTPHPVEDTRLVQKSGPIQPSIYEMDYRDLTRDVWRAARSSFDSAYTDFRADILSVWDRI